MDQINLSTLADTGPCHDAAQMPFESVDVARVARAVEAKPTRLTRLLFGLNPRGLAHLLRKLWTAHDVLSADLSTVRAERNRFRQQINVLEADLWEVRTRLRSITWQLDRVIEAYGERKSGVLIISERDMQRLDDAYDCPDKKRASSGERWAYTYRGFRVFTAREIAGPVMMPPAIFEGFKLSLGTAVVLRER